MIGVTGVALMRDLDVDTPRYDVCCSQKAKRKSTEWYLILGPGNTKTETDKPLRDGSCE